MSADAFQAPKKDIDITSVLARAWALFAAKPAEHILAAFLVALVGGLTLGILAGPLTCGYIRMVDKQKRGEAIAIGDVFDGMSLFAPAFAASLIIGLCAFIGMLLFVVPGLAILLIWGYALWFIALKNESAMGSLAAAYRLLKDNPGSVLVVFLAALLVNSAGSLLVLGTLVSFPFGVILASVAFDDLTRAHS